MKTAVSLGMESDGTCGFPDISRIWCDCVTRRLQKPVDSSSQKLGAKRTETALFGVKVLV